MTSIAGGFSRHAGFLAVTTDEAGQGTVTEFQVFLSHNSQDKPTVRELARCLEDRGIRVWLDEEQLIPGRNWQPLLEDGIRRSRTGAVLVGKDGLGPWVNQEMQALLRQAVASHKPVIPVLLPGAPSEPELPAFLLNNTWVDLRGGFTKTGIDSLLWGITGEKPEALKQTDHPPQATAAAPAALWPDHTLAAQPAEPTDGYSRLYAICTGGEVLQPQERRALWQAVKKQRPSSFLAWQLANVARWSATEYLAVDERFTPLRVHVRVRESAEAPAEKQALPFDTLAEAMSAVFEEQAAPASVIFAPPGGGKSTLLRHHQLQQARRLTEAALEEKADTDGFLQAGCNLGLFEDEAAQADNIRFVHQQMQAYFAAWVLAEQGEADSLTVPWRSADLPESTEALLA